MAISPNFSMQKMMLKIPGIGSIQRFHITSLRIPAIKITWPWDVSSIITFSASLPLCAGNSPVTGEFPSQRPVTRSFDVFFDLRLNKHLGKQSKAIYLKRHRAHYDVTVMRDCSLGLESNKVNAVDITRWLPIRSGLILGLRPANERRCYKVTPSLIGCAILESAP